MTNDEFSREMDVLYENINKGGAVGLDAYEKSVILTNAQNKLVFQILEGGDLSLLAPLIKNLKVPTSVSGVITVANKGIGLVADIPMTGVNTGDIYVTNDTFELYEIKGTPPWDYHRDLVIGEYIQDGITGIIYRYTGTSFLPEDPIAVESATLDPNGVVFAIDKPYIRILTENVEADGNSLVIVPITLQQYDTLISKPYRFPKRRTVWRIMQGYSVTTAEEGDSGITYKNNNVELIGPFNTTLENYTAQLLLEPQPIILEDLVSPETIRGLAYESETNLIASLHPTILEYAVTLAEKYYFDKYGAAQQQAAQ